MMKLLQAEPEPLEIDVNRLAVVVLIMQNFIISDGGLFDFFGRDRSGNIKIIEPIKKITSGARAKGVKVIYVAHVLSPDLREVGPNSPYWYREVARLYREKPEVRDKLYLRGNWGAQIVDELKPHEDDLLIEMPRFSAFVGTGLDITLRSYDIKYLAFVGANTSVTVEGSIRDAEHLDYFPILVSDATAATRLEMWEEAIFTVKSCLGWVTTTENFLKAIQ